MVAIRGLGMVRAISRRRLLLRLPIVTLAAAFGLPGCSRPGPFRIGIHPWPGYEPLLLARNFGWLPEQVVLHEGGTASDSMRGLREGRLDAACLTLDEVLTLRAGGVPLTTVLVMDESVGADVVLAQPEIRAPAELGGKRLAVERSAVGNIVLQHLLAAAALQESDLHLVDLPVDRHIDLWQKREIDAAISYPPYASHLRRLGAVPLIDSRQFPQTIFDVLAVRSDRLGAHATSLRATLAAHFRALDHLRQSREDAFRRIGTWRRLSLEEVQAGYAGLHLPDLAANRRLLAGAGPLAGAAQRLVDIMMTGGSSAMLDALAGLVSDAYLPRQP